MPHILLDTAQAVAALFALGTIYAALRIIKSAAHRRDRD